MIADKSQPVIIMALGEGCRQRERAGGKQPVTDATQLLLSSHDKDTRRDLKRSQSAAARDVHYDLLPDGVVGHKGDRLLLIRHGLGGVDYILEHGSLSTWGEHRGSLISLSL